MDIYVIAMIVLSYPFWKLMQILAAYVVHWKESRKWKRHWSSRPKDLYVPTEQDSQEEQGEMSDDIEFPQQYALTYAEQFHLLNTGQVRALRTKPDISRYSVRLRAMTNTLEA